MKRFTLTILSVIFILFAMAQDQQTEIAAQALKNYKQLLRVQPDNESKALLQDESLLILGAPLSTSIIPLDKLKLYRQGQPVNQIVTKIDRLVYPIINSRTKKVVNSLSIEKSKDKWVISSFGTDKKIAEKISEYGKGISNFEIVRIPAFNLSFISYQEGGTLRFVPLQDDRQKEIVQGRAQMAENIVLAYVNAANEYNGLPW